MNEQDVKSLTPPFLKRFHFAGSIVGLVFFIIYGFRVGLEFGTFGGRLLADNLIPDDIAYTVLQGIVMSIGTVFGILLAMLCTISFFMIIFTIAADLIGRLYGVIFRSKQVEG